MAPKRISDNGILLAEINLRVSEKTATATADRIALRDAVCAYLLAERARGTTISTVVRSVSKILLKAGRADNAAQYGIFAQELIDWCLSQPRAHLSIA